MSCVACLCQLWTVMALRSLCQMSIPSFKYHTIQCTAIFPLNLWCFGILVLILVLRLIALILVLKFTVLVMVLAVPLLVLLTSLIITNRCNSLSSSIHWTTKYMLRACMVGVSSHLHTETDHLEKTLATRSHPVTFSSLNAINKSK